MSVSGATKSRPVGRQTPIIWPKIWGFALLLRSLLLAGALVSLTTEASANVIWPAALLTGRMLAWWIIGLSLVIECVFVRLAFRLSLRKTILVTLTANAVSAAIGLFAIPALGIAWEFGSLYAGLKDIGWDTFSLASWIATFILAVAFNVVIEIAVYRYGFKLPIDRRVLLLIMTANVITAGLALLSLDVIPDSDYGVLGPGVLAK
jgi:hypothetical protein